MRVHRGRFLASGGKTDARTAVAVRAGKSRASDAPVKRKTPLSRRDNGGQGQRVMGLEPTTFTLAKRRCRRLEKPESVHSTPFFRPFYRFPVAFATRRIQPHY